MRLSKPMIKIFTQIAKGSKTIESLAIAQKKSVNRIVEVLQDLDNEGFIIKKRNYTIKGSRILVEVAHTSHALKLKELLFEYSGISFEDIISEGRLLFLAAISEDWMSTKIATQLSGISKYAIERYCPELKNRGIIEKDKNLYRINEKAWPFLKEFLIDYKKYSSIEGQVKWKFDKEALFEVNDEKLIQNNVTGLYAYQNYGVKVGVISALCFMPQRKLSKEEVFVHSLFEVDDPRTLHLAITFYIKNKLNYKKVLPIAMKYGKYTMFNNFIKILKTKEENAKFGNLPKFDRKDFIRIANMYGVNNV